MKKLFKKIIQKLFGWALEPTASPTQESVLFFDLDRMISDPVPFKFNGKICHIKKMSTETFLATANGLAGLDMLQKTKKMDMKSITDAYVKLISSACDGVTKKEIEMMTPAQKGALCQQIIDCVSGQGQTDSAEKKN